MALVLQGDGTMTVGNGDITGLSAGAIESTAIGAGAIRQVVNAYDATSVIVSTTNTSFVTSGLSVSITPSLSTSKILILFSSYGCYVPSSSQQLIVALYRNGSNITTGSRGWCEAESVPYAAACPLMAQMLDSPNTTSTQTYTVYFRSVQGGNCYLLNNGPNYGSLQLTALEIAA